MGPRLKKLEALLLVLAMVLSLSCTNAWAMEVVTSISDEEVAVAMEEEDKLADEDIPIEETEEPEDTEEVEEPANDTGEASQEDETEHQEEESPSEDTEPVTEDNDGETVETEEIQIEDMPEETPEETPEEVSRKPFVYTGTKFIGHRGYSYRNPENTLVSFQAAFDVGDAGIECDVFESKNGDLMIMHDSTTKRMCGKNVSIYDVNTTNRSKYPIVNGNNSSKYKNQTILIPTFEETLELVKKNGGVMFLELKGIRETGAKKIAEEVLAAGMQEQVFVISFHVDMLKYFEGSGLHYGPLQKGDITVASMKTAEEYGCDGIFPWPYAAGKVSNEFVKYCHDNGFWVCNGEAKTAAQLKNLTENKVDFVTSNFDKSFAKDANTITASNVTKNYSAKSRSFSLGAKALDNAPLTYKSNHKSVTVSKTGKVTIKKKFIGQATITITAGEVTNYKKATKKITIKVNPLKTTLSSVKNSAKKTITVKWKKNTTATGYQIQYATDRTMKKNRKTVTIKKKEKVSKKLYSLKRKKNYYVRIRTYKTVSGKNYYSSWSGVKSVKIKK